MNSGGMSENRSLASLSSGSSIGNRLNVNELFGHIRPTSIFSSQSEVLQQKQRRESARTSTAVTASGMAATADSSKVRMYQLAGEHSQDKIGKTRSFAVSRKSEGEAIRSIALSDEVLAVLTHHRLILYEHMKNGEVTVEDTIIDNSGTWTPKTVAILQIGSAGTGLRAVAWVAVGGVGKVKIFEYPCVSAWNRHQYNTSLSCMRHGGIIQTVTMSYIVPANKIIVCGVDQENKIHVWDVRVQDSGGLRVASSWELNYSSRVNEPSHRLQVTSATVFKAASGRLYIFVTVDQRHGSHPVRTFIAPLEHPRNSIGPCRLQWRALPDTVASRNVLQGAVTANGRFLVTVEEKCMRIITLKPAFDVAFDAGLACFEDARDWKSSLEVAATNVSAISLSVQECDAVLRIIAIDAHGHVVRVNVDVPGFAPGEPPMLRRASDGSVVSELPPSIPPEMPGAPMCVEMAANEQEDEIQVIRR